MRDDLGHDVFMCVYGTGGFKGKHPSHPSGCSITRHWLVTAVLSFSRCCAALVASKLPVSRPKPGGQCSAHFRELPVHGYACQRAEASHRSALGACRSVANLFCRGTKQIAGLRERCAAPASPAPAQSPVRGICCTVHGSRVRSVADA